jgi:hypothetical protein
VQADRDSLPLLVGRHHMDFDAIVACACAARRRVLRISLGVALLCCYDVSVRASTDVTPHVRSSNPVLLRLIEEGTERSTTFRRLVDAINMSSTIVYVEFGFCAFGHLDGCLLPYVTESHGTRFVRAIVTPDRTRRSHDQLLALIGHELQHVVEVTQHDEVVDVRSMQMMFARIGTPVKTARTGYETSAARDVGDAVLSEVSRRHVEGRTAQQLAQPRD